MKEILNVLMAFSLNEKQRIEEYVGHSIEDDEEMSMTIWNLIEECLGSSDV